MLTKTARYLLITLGLLTMSTRAISAPLSIQLDELARTTDEKQQEQIIHEILQQNPSPDTIITLLRNLNFKKPEKIGIIVQENLCIDGIKRPFCWYIPQNYEPSCKTPLLVYLHGLVNQKNISENLSEYEAEFIKIADDNGYILLFPLGQSGATWWDSVGIANVLQQILVTKRHFNIDDNRVFMAGFSDGASGAFLFAMNYPTDFAGFIPLNGHPGVASIDGSMHTYFINLFNRPLYVINTDEDKLYPSKEITPMIELAQRAGADILYKIYSGIGHSFDYAHEELPLITKFMETHPRVLPSIIKWETADPGLGCMWLSIDSITHSGHAEWYQDYNIQLVDARVMFGFIPDETYEGIGVRVEQVVGESTLCRVLGIKEGDIFVKLGDSRIIDLNDVTQYKEDKECGDSAHITILREGKELTLRGVFPGPTIYDLFRREKPSARAEVYYRGNTFSIRASQLGAFTIYIHPEMVKLDQNIVIELNGKKVFDKRVTASPEFILRTFLENRDRELLYVNEISVILQ
jgi:pimeloyl-ACP methyl ester carboxylesterase